MAPYYSSYKRPNGLKLAYKHLKCLKSILAFIQDYTIKYRFIFDEKSSERWTSEVEEKLRHIHMTLDHIIDRGTHTNRCDDAQKTLLVISDIDTYLKEVIDFVECRTDPKISSNHITISQITEHWHLDHDQLIQMETWVRGLLNAIFPIHDTHTDMTQGLSHAIHSSMMNYN